MGEKHTLKGCPFCGGEARFTRNAVDFEERWSVVCADCPAWHDECGWDRDDAAEAWNRRAADPVTADLLEALNEIASYCRQKPGGEPGSYQRGYDIGFNNAGLVAAGIARAALAKAQPQQKAGEGQGHV